MEHTENESFSRPAYYCVDVKVGKIPTEQLFKPIELNSIAPENSVLPCAPQEVIAAAEIGTRAVEVIKDVRTYADILQEPKALQTPTETIKEIHSVTIFLLKEDTPDETKTKSQKEINPTKLKLGIKDVRKLKKGGLGIQCDTKRDIDILKR
ncbi:hypothetical protein AVEN_177296-1 [Araneus ventricosus]|uniref:Uncharacterized protein n=1 Tax=Araneus ventricosus TaxID=182803 RepID=A0A4Y2C4D1_ARAVE|nr:hypothetical protein AVEN_177296-1 [Araneus ventricosus]